MTDMISFPHIIKAAVTAVTMALPAVSVAQDRLSNLMAELRLAPGDVEANRIAGEIELLWRQSGSATADFLLKRGQDAVERGDDMAALDHFSALIDHAPEFTEGWVSRASLLLSMEKFGQALSDIEHALALNPQHYEAIFGLGVILELIGRPKDAYEALELVRSIHPHYPDLTDVMTRLEPLAKGQAL